MHAASRHGTNSLTALSKDSGVSSFGRSSGRSPIQFLTVHSHASWSIKGKISVKIQGTENPHNTNSNLNKGAPSPELPQGITRGVSF